MKAIRRAGARVVGLRVSLVVAVLGLAVSGPASATAPQGRSDRDWAARACTVVARLAGDLGGELTLKNATFSGGTMRDDLVSVGNAPVPPGERIPVWCGFAGDDVISDNWGWVYGGAGDDGMGENWLVFKGGPGNDNAGPNHGYFAGGWGDDSVTANYGTFDGGPGNDAILGEDGPPNMGTFNGGPGNDRVDWNASTFNGGRGRDYVGVNSGTFDGGPGYDVVGENHGTCINVEVGC